MLGDGGVATEDAAVAVAALVAELQEGWDTHDADLTNRHFAADLLWGSPFGADLQGYEPLHADPRAAEAGGTGRPGLAV